MFHLDAFKAFSLKKQYRVLAVLALDSLGCSRDAGRPNTIADAGATISTDRSRPGSGHAESIANAVENRRSCESGKGRRKRCERKDADHVRSSWLQRSLPTVLEARYQ